MSKEQMQEPLDPEQVLSLQEQADKEQFLKDREQVLSCLRSEGFRVLQAQWQLQVQAYRELLSRPDETAEKLRFYQGAIRAWADFKSICEAWMKGEEE